MGLSYTCPSPPTHLPHATSHQIRAREVSKVPTSCDETHYPVDPTEALIRSALPLHPRAPACPYPSPTPTPIPTPTPTPNQVASGHADENPDGLKEVQERLVRGLGFGFTLTPTPTPTPTPTLTLTLARHRSPPYPPTRQALLSVLPGSSRLFDRPRAPAC